MSIRRRRLEGFRLLYFDIQLDVDNWNRLIEYIQTRRKYDPTTLRKMLIQSYTLMHDINHQRGHKAAFARESILHDMIETQGDAHPVITIVNALKELVYHWNKIRSEVETETKVKEPGKYFWDFIIRAEKVIFQLMAKEIPKPSTQKLQQPADESINDGHREVETLERKESTNTKSDQFTETQKATQSDHELDNLIRELQELKRENDRLKAELRTLETSQHNREDLLDIEKQLTDKELEIQELKSDKEQLLTRLSKLAADRLTLNNPNIADLSDSFRPTKLAEIYSQIYDDEWTDALEGLITQGRTDKEAIVILRDRLLDAFDFCKMKHQEMAKRMSKAVKIKRASLNPRGSSEIEDSDEEVGNKIRRLIKEVSHTSLPIVKREYMSLVWNDAMPGEMKPYLEKCLLVTWIMAVQDPPMTFAKPADVTDTTVTLDTSMYRHYMTYGTFLDYTLWPCLLLHEHGPVVAKGVAEAKTKVTNRRSVIKVQLS